MHAHVYTFTEHKQRKKALWFSMYITSIQFGEVIVNVVCVVLCLDDFGVDFCGTYAAIVCSQGDP